MIKVKINNNKVFVLVKVGKEAGFKTIKEAWVELGNKESFSNISVEKTNKIIFLDIKTEVAEVLSKNTKLTTYNRGIESDVKPLTQLDAGIHANQEKIDQKSGLDFVNAVNKKKNRKMGFGKPSLPVPIEIKNTSLVKIFGSSNLISGFLLRRPKELSLKNWFYESDQQEANIIDLSLCKVSIVTLDGKTKESVTIRTVRNYKGFLGLYLNYQELNQIKKLQDDNHRVLFQFSVYVRKPEYQDIYCKIYENCSILGGLVRKRKSGELKKTIDAVQIEMKELREQMLKTRAEEIELQRESIN